MENMFSLFFVAVAATAITEYGITTQQGVQTVRSMPAAVGDTFCPSHDIRTHKYTQSEGGDGRGYSDTRFPVVLFSTPTHNG